MKPRKMDNKEITATITGACVRCYLGGAEEKLTKLKDSVFTKHMTCNHCKTQWVVKFKVTGTIDIL